MTVLSTIQAVCTKIGLDVPTAVIGSTDREHVELTALANEMAERIAERHEWQKLKKEATFTGDGVIENFDLPSDYDRMLQGGEVWNSRTNNPMDSVDTNTWLGREVRGYEVYSAYTFVGNQMQIRPVMATGETARFYYISNQFITGAGGDDSTFMADADTFLLPERLLRLGIIWQWRESKGLPYAEDMNTFEEALAREIRTESGAKMLRIGRSDLRGYKTAYPQIITS